MDRKTNKNKRKKKHNIRDFEVEQDDNFSFIAGYTSGGFLYGNPWEETDDELDGVEDTNTLLYIMIVVRNNAR